MTNLFDGEMTGAGIVWLITEIGAANWLFVEAFDTNLVTQLFGTSSQLASITYLAVGLAGVLSLAGSLGVIDLGEVLP